MNWRAVFCSVACTYKFFNENISLSLVQKNKFTLENEMNTICPNVQKRQRINSWRYIFVFVFIFLLITNNEEKKLAQIIIFYWNWFVSSEIWGCSSQTIKNKWTEKFKTVFFFCWWKKWRKIKWNETLCALLTYSKQTKKNR